MATELADQLTPVSKEGMARALWLAWYHLFDDEASRKSILLLLSHWALETGWGESMHCYNVGNVKSVNGDGYDYTFFKCNELINGKWVWFYPKAAGCRFRAFSDLNSGVIDYLSIVHKRFAKCWPAVLAGDPVAYATALKGQGYFTAPLQGYVYTLTSIFNSVQNVRFSQDPPELTQEEIDQISNQVLLSIMQDPEQLRTYIPNSEPEPEQ